MRTRSLIRLLILCSLCGLIASADAAPLRPTHAPHAMVASVHELASRAGLRCCAQEAMPSMPRWPPASRSLSSILKPEILVAVAFLLLRNANGRRISSTSAKGPAAATENMYLDAQATSPGVQQRLKRGRIQSDRRSGTVAGLVYAEKQYGKLTIEKVMAPAIKLARDGFSLAYDDAQDSRKTSTGAVFRIQAYFSARRNYYQPGDLFKQPNLPAPWTPCKDPTRSTTEPWPANWRWPFKKAEAGYRRRSRRL